MYLHAINRLEVDDIETVERNATSIISFTEPLQRAEIVTIVLSRANGSDIDIRTKN